MLFSIDNNRRDLLVHKQQNGEQCRWNYKQGVDEPLGAILSYERYEPPSQVCSRWLKKLTHLGAYSHYPHFIMPIP